MTFTPALVADLAINLIAFAAVLLATPAIRNTNAALSGTERRLQSLFRAIALLLFLRILAWFQLPTFFQTAVLIAASWLPFFALLLSEQLVRRHAASALKWLALLGSVGFSILALITGSIWPFFAISALAGFQTIMLVANVAFLWLHRKDDLAPSETAAVDAMAIAMLFTLPFALGDFRSIFPELPVRIGAVGILLFALSMTRIAARSASPRSILIDYFGIFLTGVTLTALISYLVDDASVETMTRLLFIIVAVIIAMLLLQRQRDLDSSRAPTESISPALTAIPDNPTLEQLLSAHPLLSSGTIIDDRALGIYDPETVAILADKRVVSTGSDLNADTKDALGNLLAGLSASHLVRLSKSPPKFLAVACGPFRANESIEAELDLASRLAQATAK